MSLAFLTPLAALVGLAAALPLAALLAVSRRAGRVRKAVGLPGRAGRLLGPALAVTAAGALLGLAAAQPVLERTTTRLVRSDAEAFVVVDVSRSMLAGSAPGSATRLERARDAAADLRLALPGIPVGIASLTDRVLPHLLPSPDEDVFLTTLDRAIGIERPPPRSSILTNATSFDSLAAVATQEFFSPAAKSRLLVVLTDGESLPVNVARLGRRFRRAPAIRIVFVQFWDAEEQVFTRGVPEPAYRPDPSARTIVEGLAVATRGSVHGEGDLEAAARRSRELLGSGPSVSQGTRSTRHGLASYLAVAAFLPLAFLLGRRDR